VHAGPGGQAKRGESHATKQDHAAALNKAFDAAERQLEKLADLQNADAKPQENAGQSGMVVWLLPEQNCGFTEIDNWPELYLRATPSSAAVSTRLTSE
jgi:hypothetical protein